VAELTSESNSEPASNPARESSTAVTVGAVCVALAVILMALAGLGSRWGWWYFTTGFALLKWAAYAAIAAAIVTVVAALLIRGAHRNRSLIIAAVAVVIAFGIVSVPWRMMRAARARRRCRATARLDPRRGRQRSGTIGIERPHTLVRFYRRPGCAGAACAERLACGHQVAVSRRRERCGHQCAQNSRIPHGDQAARIESWPAHEPAWLSSAEESDSGESDALRHDRDRWRHGPVS